MGEHYFVDDNPVELRAHVGETLQKHGLLEFSVHALAGALEQTHHVSFDPQRMSWAKLDSDSEKQESLLIVTGDAMLDGSKERARAVLSLSSNDDFPSELEILAPNEL